MSKTDQRAEVTLDVVVPVDEHASETRKKEEICRQIRFEMGSGVEVKPPLLADSVTLKDGN